MLTQFRSQFVPALLAVFALLLAGASSPGALGAETTLIPAGSVWKYLDNGSNQATAWRGTSFSDAGWASGSAELGYGDGDEATVVGFGPNSSAKYITTYFRRSFDCPTPSAFATLKLRVIRDDGIVVYLNGQEVWRNNMPTGTIAYTTLAGPAIGSADEYTFVEAIVPATHLTAGNNVLAAEVHQSNATSTDLSFNLELIGRPPGLVRQPYLQIGTPTSVTIRWRTDIATDSVARFGRAPEELTESVTANQGTPTTEHQVTLTGLAPDTRYYYSVGSSAATFASGEAHVFFTSPPAGKPHPTRIWVLGDAGTGTANQLAVRNAYYSYAAGAYTDVLLMLGDNVYETGTDNEYTSRHFGVYHDMLRQTVSWPTIGNHDTAASSNPSPTIPYYQSFSLPTSGQAGGVPSGTEDYYSFDYGDIHFICLDSMTENRGGNATMANWLRQDLGATTQKWVIAYFHHPPYSKGHDSDTDPIQTEMRANIVPILEEYGVDLVLSGHSHGYERSYLLDGHYGTSSTLNGTHFKDQTDGTGVGGYNKPTENGAGREGAVYTVAGSSGKTQDYPGINDNGSGNGIGHPAHYISWERMGSLIIDVDGHRMDVKFLRETGVIADAFTITRGPRTNLPPTVAITSPANGAEFNRNSPITIQATATDSDQGVDEVVVYANSSRIATLPANEGNTYTFNWTPPANGNYRFEVRAVDELGNSTSAQPVDVTVSTGAPAPDTTAPAAIANLTTVVGITDVTLSWRAPGDDGADVGAAASYDLRYSVIDPATDPSPDKAAWWADADLANDEPLPLAAGNTQQHAITGLVPESTYYFAIKATDDAGNTSLLSNVATATTLREPPAPPATLTAVNGPGGRVDLAWEDRSYGEDGFSIERSLDKATGYVQIQLVGPDETTFSDTLVYAGGTYHYRVSAIMGGIASAHSNIASVTTPPPTPSPFSATSTKTSVSLTWGASNGAVSYTVWRLDPITEEYVVVASGFTVTNYTDLPLASGASFSYRVTASNPGGTSAPAEVTIQTVPLAPPSAPTSLDATATGTTTIQLAWVDTADNESAFAIERALGNGSFAEVATTEPNATGYSDAGLAQGTLYRYRVRAINPDGFSAYSNEASATTLMPPPPVAPGNLTASSSMTEVVLNWSASAGSDSYAVTRLNPSTGNFDSLIAGLAGTTFTDTGLTIGTSYTYRVQGVNVSGAGAPAEITIQTKVPNPPSAPSNLTASATGISTVQLAWVDTAGNETGFVIERSTDGVAFVQVGTAGADATAFGDANLAAGTAYYYRVSALNADGPSGYSNLASATTLTPQPPAAPSNMTATATSGTTITVAWTDNAANEDGFVLQRALNGGAFITIATLSAGTIGYPDTGLQSGANYSYRVHAFNSAGSSAYAQAAATTLSAPVVPASFTAIAVSKSQINLAWSDVSGETNYVIERSINSDRNFAALTTLGANVTSFSDTGLAPAKTYFYRLRAVNSVGSSANIVVSATTPKK